MIDVHRLPKTSNSNGLHAVSSDAVYAQKGEGWMVKIDAKAGEEITLRKGTLWAIGVAPVLLMLVFNYGGSLIGFVREDTTTKNQLQQVILTQAAQAKATDELNQKVDKLAETIQSQQVINAKQEGIKLGMAASK